MVRDRHDSIPIRNGQRATRNKIVLNIDKNQRRFRHRFADDTIRNSMADQPIIHSLLDVDFYKDTMGQMIYAAWGQPARRSEREVADSRPAPQDHHQAGRTRRVRFHDHGY